MANRLFGHRLDSMSVRALLKEVDRLVNTSKKGYITFCNVHMIMEAEQDENFATVLENSLLNLTDGAPLVRILKQRNVEAHRTAGPDMMPKLLTLAAQKNWPVGYYGGSESTLDELVAWTHEHFPGLKVGFAKSPPFRKLTEQEHENDCEAINASSAKLLFVGLGCPKQEWWMHENNVRINPIMLGVGGAFSMVTGKIKRAPRWMQKLGLEWLFRFLQEPKRLWQRYLVLNMKFIWKLLLSKV